MNEEVNVRRLYIIQTYGIGKERVFIEVCPGVQTHMPHQRALPHSSSVMNVASSVLICLPKNFP